MKCPMIVLKTSTKLLSVNKLYMPLGRHVLTPEARVYKQELYNQFMEQLEAQKQCIPTNITSNTKFELSYTFEDDWYYKNGKIKRRDLDAPLKALQDITFTALSSYLNTKIDDSQIWNYKDIQKIQQTVPNIFPLTTIHINVLN